MRLARTESKFYANSSFVRTNFEGPLAASLALCSAALWGLCRRLPAFAAFAHRQAWAVYVRHDTLHQASLSRATKELMHSMADAKVLTQEVAHLLQQLVLQERYGGTVRDEVFRPGLKVLKQLLEAVSNDQEFD